ncbi:hypothetical protein AbraCBS73388_001483 [Aspergillus brasiliensis]|uniref:Uncharacterized protein n=1 Tax=Aspergillus brasiliensis TaxID=319629 RepID=A0A9W5YK57_9EURO|nr:hypothetical protein AbraCBS73388_001483 [Aspergillus brasiliensis]
MFQVSNCGNYLLVASSRTVFVYRLLTKGAGDNGAGVAFMTEINCPIEVLAASIDASTPTLVVALLLRNRQAMVCDLIPARVQCSYGLRRTKYARKVASQHFFDNVCSQDDPPRSVSICPGRRCVAFGSFSCLELRRYDPQINRGSRFQIPVWQPPEFLHFLPRRPESPGMYRILSSLANNKLPGCRCTYWTSEGKRCVFHRSPWGSGWDIEPRWSCNCRAIPISDGVHVLLVGAYGKLYLMKGDTGTDRGFFDVITFEHPVGLRKNRGSGSAPNVFAAGSDLTWGLRVVAAYDGTIVLYSVPLDVLNAICEGPVGVGDLGVGNFLLAKGYFFDRQESQEHRGLLVQNEDKDWGFIPSGDITESRLDPRTVYGKKIGQVDGVVELAVQSSNHSVRVWAFSDSGQTSVIDLDTFTSASRPAADIPCQVTIGSDGDIESADSADKRTSQSSLNPTRKRKHYYSPAEFGGQRSRARWLHDLITEEVEPSLLFQLEEKALRMTRRMSRSMHTTFFDLEIPESVSPGQELCRTVN